MTIADLKVEHNEEVTLARRNARASQEDGDTSFYHAEMAWERAYQLQKELEVEGHTLNTNGLFS